ncbi:Fic/DOC family protein [Neisseria chenwenguii]|uniref:protein adenylyltransferase n=1 Tax=Neisseria chenwenguii TaxID=1853278 RepID=A0A220S1U3_9NEIS|nr:Fic family protein [Neisseria chenwenguii]ASK27444.1 hypothetical protein BG910_06545 [Neisseria chenwenguii]ROV56591.1 hypothetical protein EGS38_04240 [Neisseria chenwenguii]
MSNPYTDENGLFHNKLGITDQTALNEFEYHHSAMKAEAVLSGEIKLDHSSYDLAHLKDIHKALFGDIYEWAGQERTRPSVKGNNLSKTVTFFLEPEKLQEKWQEIQKLTQEFSQAEKLDLKTAKEKLVGIMIEANYSHPFPEGNGRTLQVFMTQLANEQNLKMDYSKVDAEMWNMANALSVPHSKRYEGHLIDVPPNKEMLGRMMDKVIQEPTQSQNLQIQFEQLDKVYQENQHLLSPKQKLIIHEAEKIIQQLPPQAQLQAKVNLYQSISEDIQKHPQQFDEPEIDR